MGGGGGGVKLFLLCDSETGYIVNAEIYTGKSEAIDINSDLGATGMLSAASFVMQEQITNIILYLSTAFTHLACYFFTFTTL